MEHVWLQEFSKLFIQFLPHSWYIMPVEVAPRIEDPPIPEDSIYSFFDSAKVRFCCEVSEGASHCEMVQNRFEQILQVILGGPQRIKVQKLVSIWKARVWNFRIERLQRFQSEAAAKVPQSKGRFEL